MATSIEEITTEAHRVKKQRSDTRPTKKVTA